MKKIILFQILLSCLLLSACGDKKQQTCNSNILFPDITLTDFVETPVPISSLFDEYRVIELETTDESLIGGRNNKVIKCMNSFFVQSLNEVLIFDLNGKYLNKLSKTGSGPDEYEEIWDFDINLDLHEIWISSNKKILRYNVPDFKFIGQIPLNFFCKKIKILKDNTFIALTPDEKVFNICSYDGKVLQSYLDKDLANSSEKTIQFVTIDTCIVSQLANTNSIVCYDTSTSTFSLDEIIQTTGIKIETPEVNRQYYDLYGYLDFSQKTMDEYIGIISFRKIGNQTIMSVRYPGPKGAIIINNGTDNHQYIVRPDSKLINDLSGTENTSFLMLFSGCESSDSFLFASPSNNPDQNMSLIEVDKFR